MKKTAYIIFVAALIFSHFTVGITCYSYAHMMCAIAHGGASAPAYIVFYLTLIPFGMLSLILAIIGIILYKKSRKST